MRAGGTASQNLSPSLACEDPGSTKLPRRQRAGTLPRCQPEAFVKTAEGWYRNHEFDIWALAVRYSDPKYVRPGSWSDRDGQAPTHQQKTAAGWVKLARPPSAGQPIRLSSGGTSSAPPRIDGNFKGGAQRRAGNPASPILILQFLFLAFNFSNFLKTVFSFLSVSEFNPAHYPLQQ